jgi:hypothetical protein
VDWLPGGCHCGLVRFRVRTESQQVLDCNCSICTKKGFLHLIVEEGDFELLQGADALTTYRFNTGVARHQFCRACGIHCFYRPRSHPACWDVNVRCLDEGHGPFEVVPFNGRDWQASVQEIR